MVNDLLDVFCSRGGHQQTRLGSLSVASARPVTLGLDDVVICRILVKEQ